MSYRKLPNIIRPEKPWWNYKRYLEKALSKFVLFLYSADALIIACDISPNHERRRVSIEFTGKLVMGPDVKLKDVDLIYNEK